MYVQVVLLKKALKAKNKDSLAKFFKKAFIKR